MLTRPVSACHIPAQVYNVHHVSCVCYINAVSPTFVATNMGVIKWNLSAFTSHLLVICWDTCGNVCQNHGKLFKRPALGRLTYTFIVIEYIFTEIFLANFDFVFTSECGYYRDNKIYDQSNQKPKSFFIDRNWIRNRNRAYHTLIGIHATYANIWSSPLFAPPRNNVSLFYQHHSGLKQAYGQVNLLRQLDVQLYWIIRFLIYFPRLRKAIYQIYTHQNVQRPILHSYDK